MPFILRPSIKPRERILTFGVEGTGKSTGALQIARRCPTDTMWVVDFELDNYDRLLATEFTDLTNVEVFPVDDWESLASTLDDIMDRAGPNDWCVVDSATATWSAVQSWFTGKVFNKGIDDYFVEARKAMSSSDTTLGAFEGWTDWQVINAVYFGAKGERRSGFYNRVLKMPCHVYLTAEQDAVKATGKGADEKDTVQAYGPLGFKPRGQKRLGHMPHTVLQLTKTREGTGMAWQMTTGKDRGRPDQTGTEVKNFALDYLMKVAGWKVTKGE